MMTCGLLVALRRGERRGCCSRGRRSGGHSVAPRKQPREPKPRTEPRAKLSKRPSSHRRDVKSVVAATVDSGATSYEGRGGNLIVVKGHPTNPISLYTAPRERSTLLQELSN